MTARLELGAGPGVVAAIGDVAVLVTDADAAPPIVEVVREAVAAGRPPGRGLARRLAALLTSDDADTAPDFGVLADTGRGWVVFLHGGVEATIVAADGSETRLAGVESATWVDRVLPAETDRVLIAPDGTGEVGDTAFELDAGVVPGGWFRVTIPTTSAATSADDATSPRSGEPDGGGRTSEMPTLVPSGATAPPRRHAPPVGDFESFSLDPSDVEAREPLPIEATIDSAAETRPPLGLLVFDDGATYGLDGDFVLGREPEIDAAVADRTARPIALDDPGGTVSRVHAEIRLVDREVHLVDRGSTNGTHLWDESGGAWDRLVPDQARVIQPGDRGAVGQRTFVYEPSTSPPDPYTTAPPDASPIAQTVAISRVVGVLTGDDGAAYPLDRSYVIGREPLSDDAVRRAVASPIVIRDDPQISRVHAHVSISEGAVHVRDCDTAAGTHVAAPGAEAWEPVGSHPTVLQPGWSLRVGAHVFTLSTDAMS